jgi:hypothetical protein
MKHSSKKQVISGHTQRNGGIKIAPETVGKEGCLQQTTRNYHRARHYMSQLENQKQGFHYDRQRIFYVAKVS